MNPSKPQFAERLYPCPFPPLCASAWGDDRYGLWCEIEVGGVVQRLRWIEPGEFWMGSSEAERKRFGEQGNDDWKRWIQNEAPRHRVKLTRGFWLSDTACTQALWQAVVGDSPSGVTQDIHNLELPLTQVSWDQVTQTFLPAANRHLTGAEVMLPTEAQWEYACRAGTETAYHFGEQIHSDQVNCDGNHPPPGGRQGEYRKRTVPVKALPANGWGLYQMHGNVWEWCADTVRSYTAEPVEDPDGGQDGVDRVLRGGAWRLEARFARSANRYEAPRGYRRGSIGFRFALRSIEPSAGGGVGVLDEAGGAR
jgi:formylglycine-generating enzyme required for sulfatase activity